MNLTDYAHGRIAADLMNLSTADNVWRAIAKHGARYTEQTGNEIEVIQLSVNGRKCVKRDQLEAFAKWYETAVRYPSKRPHGTAITINNRQPTSERQLAKRRLGVAIRRIQIARTLAREAGD
jgi:hypothetical protein